MFYTQKPIPQKTSMEIAGQVAGIFMVAAVGAAAIMEGISAMTEANGKAELASANAAVSRQRALSIEIDNANEIFTGGVATKSGLAQLRNLDLVLEEDISNIKEAAAEKAKARAKAKEEEAKLKSKSVV